MAQPNPTENKTALEEKIAKQLTAIEQEENHYAVGHVTKVTDHILEVSGLAEVSFYELVRINQRSLGYVNQIASNYVTIALLKKEEPLHVGDLVTQTKQPCRGKFSEHSIGRIIDLFGEDKLLGKKFESLIDLDLEKKATPIMDRTSVNRPLLTGIAGIDLIYPIGKGQRQLIIGDKKTGKTQILLDTIVNQKKKNMLCIYVAIGKTKKEVKTIYYELLKRGAMQYTVIVAAFQDDLPTVLSLTPSFALAIADYYLMKRYDSLVVIDDLKQHAFAYREISLSSKKPPGRDAYPADIFYAHSRLLEKGCQHKNGASITILPVMETKGDDITDYISTNIISITDGQIVLSSKSFQKGEKPAIHYGLSVSRLGGAVQTKEMKTLGTKVRRALLSYLETRQVYELANMEQMSPELQARMKEGKQILNQLIQNKYTLLSPEEIKARFTFLEESS